MGSGSSSPPPSVYYDLASSCWRTCAPSLVDDRGSTLSSPPLPRSGSMLSGRVSEHPTSALPISVNGGSSSPGLPTPRARDSKGRGFPDGLPVVAELLPTPTTSEATGSQPGPERQGGRSLRETLLPTPRATDGTKGGPNQRGSSGDLMLPSAVMLLPTPTSTDSKSSSGQNPAWGHGTTLTDAARQMAPNGAPIAPPSTGGPASSAGQLPIPLSPEEAAGPA